MATAIPIKDGILTICDTAFKCPVCKREHEEEDWYPKYEKSKTGLVYMKCKGCKTKLGVTTNIRGDVVVWDKTTEK